ncbi:uncharacterized protein LOC124370060 [Homalodisca vitripennis]|nr:uncharacterized protein LOC124370060 [Homalodisca vitripennis]
MDAFRQCVLLALVLLEVAGRSEDECGSGRASCEVTAVQEGMVNLVCGGDLYRSSNTGRLDSNNGRLGEPIDRRNTSTLDNIKPESEGTDGTISDKVITQPADGLSVYTATTDRGPTRAAPIDRRNTSTLDNIKPESEGTDGTISDKVITQPADGLSVYTATTDRGPTRAAPIDRRNTSTLDNIKPESEGTDGTISDKVITQPADGLSVYTATTDRGPTRVAPIDCVWYNCTTEQKVQSHWSTVTTVQVTLLRNITFLDVSPFQNARTIILNSFGYSSFVTCGAKNVTELLTSSSNVDNPFFIRHMTGLKHLDLSNNKITVIPVDDLPKSVLYLDLSYNYVGIGKSIILPEALRVLNISYNSITNDKDIILKGNLTVLDLRGNKLVCVPILEMNNLEELYMSENKLYVLKGDVFTNLTSLVVLDLRGNCLNSLEETVFQGLHKLQRLDMSENNVVSLAPATFQFLSNLIALSLSGNSNLGNLQNVEDASFLFGTGQRLQVIDASKTNLTRIPSTLTRSVRKLIISDNLIGGIQCGDLDSYPLLQTMQISNNLISDIEEDALGRLDFLSNLLLSGNKLTVIPKSLPNQLQIFDLRCNSIEKLTKYDFLGLQKLQVLLLSRNKITIIEDGAFGQLTTLEVLDLSHNPIKSLSRTSFLGPRKLREIYLISLKDLIPIQEPFSFPAPESAHLEVLNMESSPILATQLMEDVAALTMFHELFELNLNHCRLSTLRSDLPAYLPRLHKLELTGNKFNCTDIVWLVKWLQALNISMRDTGRFRREIYNLKDICCEEATESKSYDEMTVICASPAYLSGKQIISLEEEDFPDLKLTSSPHPPASQVSITTSYLARSRPNSANNTSSSVLGMIDTPIKTTLSIYNVTQIASYEVSTTHTISRTSLENTLLNTIPHEPNLKRTESTEFQDTATRVSKVEFLKTWSEDISRNRSAQKWRYLNSETKYQLATSEPIVSLLNDTNTILSDYDNHMNESISSGVYMAHGLSAPSHPGMMVFLAIVGIFFLAASTMVYSQCSRARRAREYRHHQDIEVSSFGGNELW